MIPTARIGPFKVADVGYREAVRAAATLALNPPRAMRFYALHVGGLNAKGDATFVAEMNDAELVCADGASVVALGRLAGATRIERTPTTDAGWEVLAETATLLGRPVRVALVGGRAETVEAAAATLAGVATTEVVLVTHGYHQRWEEVLERLDAARPDVLLLGLGAPKEMLWVREHHGRLPACLVVTCGGWFGFLAGEERRAPALLRRSGLEWVARAAQAPRRLLPRYARGLASCIAIAGGIGWRRLTGSTE